MKIVYEPHQVLTNQICGLTFVPSILSVKNDFITKGVETGSLIPWQPRKAERCQILPKPRKTRIIGNIKSRS